MRSLFILSVILLCGVTVISQSPADSAFKLILSPDITSQYIGGMDSLDMFIRSTSTSSLKISKGTIEPNGPIKRNGSIEPNGYRGADGVLYTMRIKVPEGNYAAIREYDWNTRLNNIDSKMIFPPVKKK